VGLPSDRVQKEGNNLNKRGGSPEGVVETVRGGLQEEENAKERHNVTQEGGEERFLLRTSDRHSRAGGKPGKTREERRSAETNVRLMQLLLEGRTEGITSIGGEVVTTGKKCE